MKKVIRLVAVLIVAAGAVGVIYAYVGSRDTDSNGFKLVGQFDELPWQHVLFFARDDSPRAGVQLVAWKAPSPGGLEPAAD